MYYRTRIKRLGAGGNARSIIVIITLITCMLAGMLVGAIAGMNGYPVVSSSLAGYLQNYGEQFESWDVFRESTLKYGKLVVIIWLLAFLPSGGFMPIGGLVASLLLLFRGAAYGFSTAALIKGYGLAGAASAVILYIPQGILLIPLYIFVAYSCISFIQKDNEIKVYLPTLIIGLVVSMLAALIDAFVIPGLVHGL